MAAGTSIAVVNCGPLPVYLLEDRVPIPDAELRRGVHPQELRLADGAGWAAARRREFLRARWLARRAWPGLTSFLGRGPGGEPEWPRGVCGSLTHAEGHVACAVRAGPVDAGLGVDLELAAKMKEAYAASICDDAELDLLAEASRAGIPRRDLLAVLFSLKEAAYKCLYPLAGASFYFHDARAVRLDYGRGVVELRLKLRLASNLGPERRFLGHFRWLELVGQRFVLTAMDAAADPRSG